MQQTGHPVPACHVPPSFLPLILIRTRLMLLLRVPRSVLISQSPRKNTHYPPPRTAHALRTVVTGRTAQAPTLSAPSAEACGSPLKLFVSPGSYQTPQKHENTCYCKLSSRSCHIRLNVSLWARSALLSKRKYTIISQVSFLFLPRGYECSTSVSFQRFMRR
jgi:hypothetical protein